MHMFMYDVINRTCSTSVDNNFTYACKFHVHNLQTEGITQYRCF